MDLPLVYTIYNSSDRNYSIAEKEYCSFININYLTSGVFFNKNCHNGLFEKNNKNSKDNKK